MNKNALLRVNVWLCLVMFALLAVGLMQINTYAQNKGDGGSGRGAPAPNPAPPAPKQDQPNPQSSQNRTEMKELGVEWRTEKFAESFQLARKEKKLLFICFYFSEKVKFPPNYDEKLLNYSKEKAVFAKVLVKINPKGEIPDKKLDEFFTQNKLEKENIGVTMDQYGNFIDKLSIPVPSSKLLDFLEAAARKIGDIEKDLKKGWEKVAKLKESDNKKDLIKGLNQIIQTNWRGYEAFVNAEKELNALSELFRARLKEIIKQYMANDKDKEENRKATLEQMETLIKDCKELPAETEAQNAISKVKKGESFPVEEKEARENKPKTEEKEAPPEVNPDDSSEDLQPVENE